MNKNSCLTKCKKCAIIGGPGTCVLGRISIIPCRQQFCQDVKCTKMWVSKSCNLYILPIAI